MLERIEAATVDHASTSRQNGGRLASIAVKRNVAIVGFTTAISAALGFVVHILVAKYFGAAGALDAFLVAFLLLYFVQNQFQAGDLLNSSFIPVYHLAICESEEAANNFFSVILVSIWLIFSVGAVCCLFFAPFLIQAAGPGLSSEDKVLAVRIFRLLALVLPVVGLAGVLASLMRAEGKFFAPAAGPLVINFFVILMIFGFSESLGIISYAAGWMLGCVAQFVLVITPLIKTPGLRLRRLDLNGSYIKIFFRKIGLLILDVPIGLVLLTLERSFGTALGPGTVSHLNYARVICSVPLNLLAAPLQTVMFSKFSQQAALGNRAELRESLEKTLRLTVFLIVPVMAVVIFFRQETVRLLFERGSFSSMDTRQTADLILYLGVSMLTISMWWLFRQAAYAIGDMISPLIAGLTGLVLYFLGNQFFIESMGASALALNWTVSFFFSDLVLGGVLLHKLGGMRKRAMLFFSLKIGFAICLVLSFLSISANAGLDAGLSSWSILPLLLKYGLASIVVYLLVAWFLGIEEVKEVAAISRSLIVKFVKLIGLR